MLVSREQNDFVLKGTYYIDFLKFLHNELKPASYLEIGTSEGHSLSFVTCDSVAVDPKFAISSDVIVNKRRIFFFQESSDDFFLDFPFASIFPDGFDLIFIDGMHRFEFALRDFMNSEKNAGKRSLILLHDVLPQNERIARRVFVPGEEGDETKDWWVGDVWKVIPILKKYRGDLKIIYFDSPPSGLTACYNLDPSSSVLESNYYDILESYRKLTFEEYSQEAMFNSCELYDTKFLIDNPDLLTTLVNVR